MSTTPPDVDPRPLIERTVSERIQAGREGVSAHDGAIVPFPNGHTGSDFARILSGTARKTVERHIAAGFTCRAFDYHSDKGEVIYSVLRFDKRGYRKEIRPLRCLGKDKHGLPLYGLSAIEGQRPLRGLHDLQKRPDAPVLVVEGETTAEAAKVLFPDHTVVTWPSGAASVRRTDVTPLAGCEVVGWPDHDTAGRNAIRNFAALALKAGATSFSIVDVPSEFGEKWDLADPVPAEHAEAYPLVRLLETARPVSVQDVERLTYDAQAEAGKHRLLGHKPGHTKIPLGVIIDAVEQLDPAMGKLEWQRVARCLYLAYGAAALPVFDDWSRGSSTKYKDGEPQAMWAAYAPEKFFRAKPLAWLMRKARDAAEEAQKNFAVDAKAFVAASVEEISENHAVVTRGGKTVVIWEQFDPRVERYTLTFLKKSDFIDRVVWKIPIPNENGKTIPIGKLWFGTAARRQYDGLLFAPGKDLGPRFLNSWQGFTVDPKNDPDGWLRLKDHLVHHVAQGDDAAYQYILNWLAFGVQHLGKPTGTAIVLIGPKGAGKSILIELYGYVFGGAKFVTSISEDIVGKFNAHLETTLLLGVEEAFAPQNRAADGTLKDLITRGTLRLEDKFFSTWTAPNHLRIMMTSNNDHVVRADGLDRRYAVFEVANPHQQDPDARRRYFGEMVEQMEAGGYSAMLGELLARDIADWNPEAIPQTDALKRQKLLNLTNDPVAGWYRSRLEDGIDILSGEADATEYLWSATETVWVPVQDVLADYNAFAKRHGHRGDDQRLKTKLARFMPADFASKPVARKEVNGAKKVRQYPFPPLSEARRLFTEVTGFPFDVDKPEAAA